MTALVSVEGVLRTDTGEPLFDGKALVQSLITSMRTLLCTKDTPVRAEYLLRMENIHGYSGLYCEMAFPEALAAARADTNSVTMVVVADPHDAEHAARQGLTVCLITASNFVRPDWKINRKSWEEIKNANNIPRG